jgi:hypothetical protein
MISALRFKAVPGWQTDMIGLVLICLGAASQRVRPSMSARSAKETA